MVGNKIKPGVGMQILLAEAWHMQGPDTAT